MNLESLKKRIQRIAHRIVGGEPPPIIFIDIADQSKGSQDEPRPFLGVIPGQPNGRHGFTLTRIEGESEDSFLRRCERAHAEFYG